MIISTLMQTAVKMGAPDRKQVRARIEIVLRKSIAIHKKTPYGSFYGYYSAHVRYALDTEAYRCLKNFEFLELTSYAD